MKAVRGYIFSRPFVGERVPQHVQNLVIRNYCEKHDLHYLLSATEYAMPGCYLVLDQVLNELPQLDGVVMYSLFQLPEDADVRSRITETFMSQKRVLHFAVEGLHVGNRGEIQRIESIWKVKQTLAECEGVVRDL
jgi:sporadic carbohydrate cluster protein (TIGR04323 family)